LADDRIQVLVNDEKRPILYDAKGQALIRPTGFQPPKKMTSHGG